MVNGPTAVVDGRQAIHLCSNDYLGLSQDTRVIGQTVKALREISQCSSRLIAGNNPGLIELEQVLAEHRKTESALVYPTGYSANIGVITAFAGTDTVIFSDELNHASIIDACRLSGASIKVFAHNDTDQLQDLMHGARGRKMIVTEGVFSMDGDISRLREICSIAKENDAVTVVDDAHGDFIFGPDFSGVPSMLRSRVDIHISSLSKGLGCFGGYVACTESAREFLINTSRQFIYTSALPDHLCVAATSAIPLAKKGDLQAKLQANVNYFRKEMKTLGYVLGNSTSHIIPIFVGAERFGMDFSRELLNDGIFAQAVRYPTVKKGNSRLRVTLTARHTLHHLDTALAVFKKVGNRLRII